MKGNISRNSAKSSDKCTSVDSDDDTKEESDYKNNSREKRNRVKIKISRTNKRKMVCDIIESSSDMIDKTPSPFTKNNTNENQHETPKKSSLSKLATRRKKLADQNLSHLSVENDLNVKQRKQTKNSDTETCLNANKKHRKELNNKTYINEGASVNAELKSSDNVELIDTDSNSNNREESNAFQILMSRNKQAQCALQTKLSPPNVNAKELEEQKERLKRNKERLIVLADKKGYSKRKLAEMEESERIEQTIQNRIKLFKGEEKKECGVTMPVCNQKQPTGTLLNYFSKTPVNIAHTETTTIVVKADVHIMENTVKQGLCKSYPGNKIQSSRKSKKLSVDFSDTDDIKVIESENIDISNNKKKQQNKQPKSRLSLRNNQCRYSLDESSEEEIFTAKRIIKSSTKNCKKTGMLDNEDAENLPLKNKNKLNGNTKLKKREEAEKSEHDKKEKKRTENEQESNTCELVQDKNVNINLKSVTLSKQDDEDCIIINDNDSQKRTTNKLAPLFTRGKKPDPETIAARRLFLQPDVIDSSNNNINKKVHINGVLPFPLISHITQSNGLIWTEAGIFNIPKKISTKYVPLINANNFKRLVDFSKKSLEPLEKVNKPKIQDVLTEIEKHCSNVKEMWNFISLVAKKQTDKAVSPKARGKRGKQAEKKVKLEYANQLECCNWTDKYRPKCSQEVVGNEEAVTKLKEWLHGVGKPMYTNDDASSGDEFYSSDSSRSRFIENNQVAILLGPHGCGKTASVYAVAEEFGYTVLELNASSKRTGKKLLKEFEEATKSHRIKNDEKISNLILNEIASTNKIPQNSLILLEDVDVIFEEDEGFISATYQLASNSKRPIVMTCRDVCPHLSKMAPQQSRIYFQDVAENKIFAYIELISLAETGYRLSLDYKTELLQSCDLRKTILQLQYLLLSGPPKTSEQSINFKNLFWQNVPYYVHKPAIKTSKKSNKKKKAINNEVTNDSKSMLTEIASKLDNIALVSSLIDIEDPALNLSQIKMQPNLSSVENTISYSASLDTCLEIAEWIGSKFMQKDHLSNYDRLQHQNNIMLRKQLNEGINSALSHTTSLLLDRQILATDYLSCVRTICRAEESRVNTNSKRGNRFFHYLHNLKAPSTLFKPGILKAACKIMHDTVNDTTQISEKSTNLIQ